MWRYLKSGISADQHSDAGVPSAPVTQRDPAGARIVALWNVTGGC